MRPAGWRPGASFVATVRLGLIGPSGSAGFVESFIGDRVGFRGFAEFGELGRNDVCFADRC